MKEYVHIQKVENYTHQEVRGGLEKIFSAFGGAEQFAKPNQKVLIKPNVICKRFEAQTHPIVVVETAKIFKEIGSAVYIGDSPAWGSFISACRSSGLYELAQKENIPLVELSTIKRVSNPDGGYYRKLTVAKEALDADVIINVPKLKTHQQLILTAGVKNMFGVVPGKLKAWWHFHAGRHNDNRFAIMVLQTHNLLKPAFTIIDAIDAMEGSGPINGNLRHIGLLIGSSCAISAEFAACRIIDFDPANLPIIQAAHTLKMIPDEIVYTGIDPESVKIKDFKFPELIPICFSLPRVIKSTTKQIIIKTKEIFQRLV